MSREVSREVYKSRCGRSSSRGGRGDDPDTTSTLEAGDDGGLLADEAEPTEELPVDKESVRAGAGARAMGGHVTKGAKLWGSGAKPVGAVSATGTDEGGCLDRKEAVLGIKGLGAPSRSKSSMVVASVAKIMEVLVWGDSSSSQTSSSDR